MKRPFDWVKGDAQGRLLVILTILLVTSSVWLLWIGQALMSSTVPEGIVSFELARSAQRSGEILASWSQQAREVALLIQGFDYLYLLIYPAWFSLAASRLGARLGGTWARPGVAISWAILLAAPLDAVENYALIEQLLQGATAVHASLAWWCAVPKFVLLVIAMLYVLSAACALLVFGVRHFRGEQP